MLVNDDGNEVVTCPECPHCHRLFCAQCKVAWHGGMKCGQFMSLNENEREKEDLMVMNLAEAQRITRRQQEAQARNSFDNNFNPPL
ncbi:hypothetical protein Ahy_B02g057858 isoform A [Arachis hypogaea]|uniref:Uncharacterized protein n=1 Tax=Arachis hypogaea TaxID=3818 RepID=A0A445AD01_ARAHY|nr:hypothetical protein Ahy_B02g057858 isoform A [Arachis hypogaea]